MQLICDRIDEIRTCIQLIRVGVECIRTCVQLIRVPMRCMRMRMQFIRVPIRCIRVRIRRRRAPVRWTHACIELARAPIRPSDAGIPPLRLRMHGVLTRIQGAVALVARLDRAMSSIRWRIRWISFGFQNGLARVTPIGRSNNSSKEARRATVNRKVRPFISRPPHHRLHVRDAAPDGLERVILAP